MLREFLAVTMTSVYHVRDGMNESGSFSPTATKIAVRGESKIPVGQKLELKGGNLIAICDQLVFCRRDEKGRVHFSEKHGCHSSLIVALFTDPRRARECFAHHDLSPCDARWENETLSVLTAFHVCKKAGLCLPICVA